MNPSHQADNATAGTRSALLDPLFSEWPDVAAIVLEKIRPVDRSSLAGTSLSAARPAGMGRGRGRPRAPSRHEWLECPPAFHHDVARKVVFLKRTFIPTAGRRMSNR